jgi:hypothetical protein
LTHVRHTPSLTKHDMHVHITYMYPGSQKNAQFQYLFGNPCFSNTNISLFIHVQKQSRFLIIFVF